MKEQWREIVLIVFVIALSIFLFTKNAQTVSESIIITEICPSGCATSDHQWIEIYNKSTESIDLNGWKFWEGGVNHGLTISPSSTVTTTILIPGAYAIIAQNDTVFFADHPDVTSTVFDSAWVTLNKTGEEIGIKKGSRSDDFVEKFVYAGVNNYSLERVGSAGDPASALEWKEHPDGSTPGVPNYWWVENGEEGETNHIPRAQMSAPTSTVVNESVVFDATGSSDSEGFIERYVWFIENIEYEGVIVEYVFTTTGTKQIVLTVYDSDGATSTVSHDIDVLPVIVDEEISIAEARIVINEFVSDPHAGDKEWIELYNAEDDDVSLDGYALYDGVGKIATVTGTINSLDFRVIYLNSSRLNQSGDIIILIDSTGDVIDIVSYGDWDDGGRDDNAPAPGKAHAVARISDGEDTGRDNLDFSYTITPTPHFSNNITPKEIVPPSSSGGSPNPHTSTQISLETFAEGTVVINEFVSSPAEGMDEFIELYNTTANTISLDGWIIQDGSLAKTLLSGTIVSKGFFVVEKPKGSLNNSGDLILLTDPRGKEIDRVVYGEWNGEDGIAPLSLKGQSTVRAVDGGEDFSVTDTITKNTPNIITVKHSRDTKLSTSTSVIGNFVTGTITLNEIFPNPTGSDDEKEFIELLNSGNTTIDLTGWKIGDASRKFTIDGTSISAGEYAVFYRSETRISLNNSGSETVSLWFPNGKLADSITYSKTVLDDESFSKFENNWIWVPTSTPGRANIQLGSSASGADSLLVTTVSTEFFPRIVEILPNPIGVDTHNEYIELHNPYDFDISLAGLFLDDASGGSKPFAFPPDTILRAHEYRAWYSRETKLSLANTSDSARILDSHGQSIEEIEYTGAKENKSYTLGNGVWFWTSELSPNMENPIAPAVDTKGIRKTKTSAVKSIIHTTLAQVRNFDVGVVASVEGVVLVPPGILSSQYMYVGSANGLGIQVYSYKKDFPPVAIGDHVVLSGELAEVSGEMRIKVASAADIKTSSTTAPVIPQRLEVVDVGDAYEGGLVEIAGEVTGVKGSYVYLDDGTDEVKVYIRGGSGIDKKIFIEGSNALVAGIVQETKSGYHVSPRSVSDVKVEGVVKGEKIEEVSDEKNYSRVEIIRAVVLLLAGLAIVLGIKLYGARIIEILKNKFK